jgi:tetratricopeptide (TPR) repeat protein
MIACKHCNTLNSLDSTFCKRCGTGLSEEELATARVELEKIVAEGFSAVAANKIEEAYAIAESAVSADPSSVQALTLKSACHERRGEVAEALECAEKIVELNPNSELDKIRRNQLRSALASAVRSRPYPGKWVAVLGGASVGVLILCCGIVFARSGARQADQNRVALNQPAQTTADLGRIDPTLTPEAPASQPPAPTTQPQQSAPQRVAAPAKSPDDTNEVDQPAPSRRSTAEALPQRSSGTLPSVDPDPTQVDVQPVEPSTVPQTSPAPAPKVTKPNTGDPQPQPEASAPVFDPGQIDIRLHGGSRRIASAGSESVSGADQAHAFAKTAENEYQIGNYSAAAIHLEQALKNGGDPVSLNERLGLSYDNLGRKSDAVSAFQRAVDAASTEIRSGQGNPTRLQKIKEVCESELAKYRGGQ